jgi:O-methyltransferase
MSRWSIPWSSWLRKLIASSNRRSNCACMRAQPKIPCCEKKDKRFSRPGASESLLQSTPQNPVYVKMWNLFHIIADLFRSIAPGPVITVAHMIYRAPGAYVQDGLITVHNSDFRRDPLFHEAYAQGKRTRSWGNTDVEWRAYVCCWAAWSVRDKDGDFVECGVNRGGLSRAVMHFVDFNRLNKNFWLLDTYEGLPARLISEAERRLGIRPGGYSACYEQVLETFRPFPGARIIKGVVPETLPQITSERICYVSLDMNNAKSEIAAAEFLWERLVKGAIIILDDYGWRKQINQKIAFDDFAARRGVKVLCLPTGQGLIFKP